MPRVSKLEKQHQVYAIALPSSSCVVHWTHFCLCDIHGVPHPWIQEIVDQKYSENKFPQSSKMQNLHFPLSCQGNYLHSIYIVFTTIYTWFTLYQVL